MSDEPPDLTAGHTGDLDRLRPIDQQFYGQKNEDIRRSKTGVLRVTSSSLKIPEGFTIGRNKTEKVPESLTLNKVALVVLVLLLVFIGFIAWVIFEHG